MFFHVRDLEARKAHFDVDLKPGAIEFSEPELKQAGNLAAEGDVELSGPLIGEIRATGRLAVRMIAECDRCLEPAAFPIEASFDLRYLPAEADTGAGAALDEEGSEIGFYEGDGIALEEVLREQVLLTLPMQRICGAECKGICPVCGENRNRVSCGCQAGAGHGRWAALRSLQR